MKTTVKKGSDEIVKVLVTGTLGYIGVEMVPALRAAGHDVVGLDTGYYDGCDFASPPDEIPTLGSICATSTAAHCRGFDAVIHLAALSNDPLGDLNPNITYDINLHASVRLARAGEGGGRAAVPVLVVVQPVRRGRRPRRSTRTPRSTRSPPTASRRCASSRRWRSWPTTSFTPAYLRNATAYGVSRAPARRHRRQQPGRPRGHQRQGPAAERRHALASAGPHRRHHPRVRVFPARAQGRIHNQAFNVGRSSENFRIRQVAEMVAEVVPGAQVTFAEGASADLRNYRVDFTEDRDQAARVQAELDPAQGDRGAVPGVHEEQDVEARVGRSPLLPAQDHQALQESGAVDADLRRLSRPVGLAERLRTTASAIASDAVSPATSIP